MARGKRSKGKRAKQWCKNDFKVEGAGAPPLENYLHPISSFSSDFGQLILKISRTKQILKMILKKCKSYVEVEGALLPHSQSWKGNCPSAPAVPTPMELKCYKLEKELKER